MDKVTPVLQVQGLCFAYPHHTLFKDWSVCLRSGATLVQGGDGSGKTTLLRLLAGELAAEHGALILAGTVLTSAPEAYRRQVFWQDPRSDGLHALSARTWFESLPAHHGAWDAQALQAHVQGFDLQPHLDKPLYQLSTGSRRKVLMAAGLASGAALTLIDEPVSGLDRPSWAYLEQALAVAAAQATQAGRAIVVAHYEAWAAVPWVDRIVLPDAG